MNVYNRIEKFVISNQSKKIAMFVDMDGTIASLDIDINNDISKNTPGYFLNKKPLQKVIEVLSKVSKFNNVEMYILSACLYKEQAVDKSKWLNKYAPFFKKDNQLFVIKEVVEYTKKTKALIKTVFIIKTIEKNKIDMVIYLDDEYLMLRKANSRLKNKILCLHISNFLE